MKTYVLNNLKPLTTITGNIFSGKTDLLNEISKEINSKYINFDTEVEIKVTEELKHWFRFVFGVDFIQDKKSNYALRIISLSLSCQESDVLIVENPEIKLHPKAANKIAKFFTYLVSNKGVKVVIETNSTDFVTSVCYEVFNKTINNYDVVFFNKTRDNIEKINVGNSGKFVDENGNLRKYPSGFFDANSAELYSLL